jgi:hypothetical protein
MTIETKKVLSFFLDQTDTTKMARAERLLEILQNNISENNQIMALGTGEVITYDDLCRARGILAGLIDNLQ